MLKRFVLAILVVASGLGTATAQGDPPTKPHHTTDKAYERVQAKPPAARPLPQKEWAEQVIEKFLAIPDQILEPLSAPKP